MTQDKQDPSRKAFEAWLRAHRFNSTRSESLERYFSYESDVRYDVWIAAWQASREQALGEAANELRGMTANHKVAQSAINQCTEALEALK